MFDSKKMAQNVLAGIAAVVFTFALVGASAGPYPLAQSTVDALKV